MSKSPFKDSPPLTDRVNAYDEANLATYLRLLDAEMDGADWREAVELLVQMLGPMMPHLAEECWARLGYNTLLANAPWPVAEAGLLVDDEIVIAVQVNGKRRDELTVSRTAGNGEVEAAAMALDSVMRALEGRKPKKVIVVPQRIVNVVV